MISGQTVARERAVIAESGALKEAAQVNLRGRVEREEVVIAPNDNKKARKV